MSVQYPPPGHSSTTFILGVIPKNVSSSTGWRALSRATALAGRAELATAAANAGSVAAADAAAQPRVVINAAMNDARTNGIDMICPSRLIRWNFAAERQRRRADDSADGCLVTDV